MAENAEYYSSAGPWDEAIAAWTEVVRLDPENAEWHRMRGLAYSYKGDHDRAIADCDRAIRLDPTYAAAYVQRGWAYAKKGDYDKAIADCSEAIRFDQARTAAPPKEPHDIRSAVEAEVAMVLVEVHWRLDHKDLARRWFDKAVVWMDKNKGEAEKLRHYRRDAGQVLGINETER